MGDTNGMLESLFEFLKSDVTSDQIFAASDKAYESKLPDDPSTITDPDGDIQKLAEKSKKKKEPKKNAKGEIEPAEQTEDNKSSEIEKTLDKETPDVDKLSDAEKETKETKGKKEVEVTGITKIKAENESKIVEMSIEDLAKELGVTVDVVKRVKSEVEKTKTQEGKLPADPSVPTHDQIQQLAEEKCLTTVSDENVANDIAKKYPGSRVVKDSQGKQFMVMVKEGVLKEDTEITVKAEDSPEVKIIATQDGGISITTSPEKPELDVDATVVPEVEADDEDDVKDGNPDAFTDDEGMENEDEYDDDITLESAERQFLANILESQGLETLTEKEKKFIEKTKVKKMSKKNKIKVAKKLKTIKK